MVEHTAMTDGHDDNRDADWAEERSGMVAVLERHGIRDPRILAAMGNVRRHQFIPEACRSRAESYGDYPGPIGHGQTISQPYIVAYMIEKLALQPRERVLEIGAGSGYQAAVLAELGLRVYAVEIVPELAAHARGVLEREGYADRVRVLTGNGFNGWPAEAPFDAMIGACAPVEAPVALMEQLKEGGRAIFPVGVQDFQRLVVFRKTGGRIAQTDDLPVRFVPMVRG